MCWQVCAAALVTPITPERQGSGRHVAGDPGKPFGPGSRLRACGYSTGAGQNAEMKGMYPWTARGWWPGTATSAMTPALAEDCWPGGTGASTWPRDERAALRGAALVSGAQERHSSWECRWLPSVGGLATAHSAQRGAEQSTALSIGPSLGRGRPGFAERSHLEGSGSWSPARPVAPAPHEPRGLEGGFPRHVEGTPLELFSGVMLISS